MSYDAELALGVAQSVAAASDLLTFAQDRAYTADEFGVYFTSDTSQTDRAVIVRLYAVDDSVADNDATVGVQFEIRAPDITEVWQICADIRALLHRAWNVTLGTVEVAQSFRRSGTGGDSGGRMSYTENYYLTVNRS